MKRSILLLLALFPGFGFSLSQTSTRSPLPENVTSASTPAIKPVIAAIRAETGPRIDGLMDDPQWLSAAVTDRFWQQDPDEGKPVSERTEAKVLYTSDAVYFGFICYDEKPEKIDRKLTRRDRQVPSDMVGVVIDSYNDDRTGFGFALNAAGVKMDLLFQNDGENDDQNWDAIWEGKVAMRPDGWSAEFKIPLRVLRFGDKPVQDWGINLVRIINRKNEEAWWAFKSKESSGFVSHFGTLSGITDIKPARSLQVTPYALTGSTYWPSDQDPAYLNRLDPQLRAGVDAQYGLSNSSILTMTVNPDFGQVEADEAVLNLSAFETFFPEKRPFFLEGTDIFNTVGSFGDGGPRTELFYTRRIGRRPRGYGDTPAGFDDSNWRLASNPTATPILGAAKLSGKTENGWSYGLINATTPRTFKVFENQSGNQSKFLTEPLSNFSVARAQYSLKGPGSYVGAIATGVAREGAHNTNAYSGGVDFRYNTDNYSLTTEGIVASTHRQTPDGKESGYHGQLRIGNSSRPNFVYMVGSNFTTKGFNANDMGYSSGDDNIMAFGWGQYRKLQPAGAFRQFRINTSVWQVRNLTGRSIQETGLNSSVNMQWKNYWNSGFGANANTSGLDPYESRGEGVFRSPARLNFWAFMSTDQRKNVHVNLNPFLATDSFGRSTWELSMPVEIKIGTRTQFSFSPSISQTYDGIGWADNISEPDGNTASIFGSRDIDQTSITLRGLHSFTADITLQAYAQYFWARGKYESFYQLMPDGELSEEPYDYSGNPNFNFSSANVNLIARYEYRPGSTVFLVWTHGRELFEDDISISANQFFTDTLQHTATNVLLLKWTYSMGL